MSLLAAYAFGNMTVENSYWDNEPPGLTQFSADSPQPVGVYDGKIQSRMSGTDVNNRYCYQRLPLLHRDNGLKSRDVGRYLILGYRIRDFVTDSNMRVVRPVHPNHVSAVTVLDPIKTFSHLGIPNGTYFEELYIEVVVDLLSGVVEFYFDGIKVTYSTDYSISPTILSYIETFGFLGFEIPFREYTAHRRPNEKATSISDIYMLQTDDVYPNARLGSVKISDVPVKVTSVSGMDKAVPEMEVLVNQAIFAGPSTPVSQNATVAKTTGEVAEIGFSLDLTEEQEQKALAACFRVAAKRTGSVPISAIIETDRYGETVSVPATDLPTNGSERINFTPPVAAKVSGAESTRKISDLTHKLKITGA